MHPVCLPIYTEETQFRSHWSITISDFHKDKIKPEFFSEMSQRKIWRIILNIFKTLRPEINPIIFKNSFATPH